MRRAFQTYMFSRIGIQMALGLLAVAGPSTVLAQRVYEGTGTEDDAPDVDAVDVRITVEGTPPNLIITYQSARPGTEFIRSGNTFEVTLSGTSYSGTNTSTERDTIVGQITCAGTISGVATVQGDPLFIRTFTAECVSGCDDTSVLPTECGLEEQQENEPDCPSRPGSKHWNGTGGGLFMDAARWISEGVPGPQDRANFVGEQVLGNTILFDQDMTNDSLQIVHDLVVFDLNDKTYTLTEGSACFPSLDIGGFDVPEFIDGTLVVTNGNMQTKSIIIGGPTGNVGVLEIREAGLAATGDCIVGGRGSGVLRVLPTRGDVFGDHNLIVNLIVGQQAGSDGGVDVRDGGEVKVSKLDVGVDQDSSGSVGVTGVDELQSSVIEIRGRTQIGLKGVATMTIRDGGIAQSGVNESGDNGLSVIALSETSIGSVRVTGSTDTQWQTAFLEIARDGDGDLIIDNNARVFSTGALMATSATASAGVIVNSGGRWQIDGPIFVGFLGTANVAIDAQSSVIAEFASVGQQGTVSAGQITIRAPTDETAGKLINRAQTIPEPVTGLVVERLVLEAGGRLNVAKMILGPGGEFAGNGSLSLDLTNNGTVSPGLDECTTGALTINADYVQESAGTLRVKLGGPLAGDSHDALHVNGRAVLAGTLHVEAMNGYQPTIGETFDILTAGLIGGEFDAITGSGEYEPSYEPNRIVLTVLASPAEISAPCGAAEDLCGGLCGGGMGSVLPLMALGGYTIRGRGRRRRNPRRSLAQNTFSRW